MSRKFVIILLGLVFSYGDLAIAADFATLEVRVEGIRHSKGEVGAGIFKSPKGFPVHLEHGYELQWVPLRDGMDSVDFVFEGLPSGDYALTVLHDENGNRKVDRNSTGLPKEGIGFSNDQIVTASAPPFRNCKMTLKEGDQKKIVIKLDYGSAR